MKPARTQLRLSNPIGRNAVEFEVDAHIDLGSPYLRIPSRLAEPLGLSLMGIKSVATPDGGNETYAYVGPLAVTIGNRSGFMSAIVAGDEVVLGTMAMTELDLIVDPSTGTAVPNPKSPDVAATVVKQSQLPD